MSRANRHQRAGCQAASWTGEEKEKAEEEEEEEAQRLLGKRGGGAEGRGTEIGGLSGRWTHCQRRTGRTGNNGSRSWKEGQCMRAACRAEQRRAAAAR